MERTFVQNLNFRETHEEFKGKKRPKYEGSLLSRDLHLSDFDIPADSLWAGYLYLIYNVWIQQLEKYKWLQNNQ